ncbi:MAG: hypothetical protein Q8N80_04635 [Candidatus Omnitrophota bacterium]|nr:hypothetical protein [Candidatus Omnitrophota bacterium]
MNKKEIYEHLANIYLDASFKSSKKRSKIRSYPQAVQGLMLVGAILVLGLGSFATYSHLHNRNQPGQIALFLYQDTVKINFNFDAATKEIFFLNLKQLNLSNYKTLAFTVRKTNPKDIISLRVEFTNRFNERSEIYIKDISNKWIDHKINLSRFGRMEYWTQMKELAFSIEKWNAREKSGIVYLDNIRILK